MRRYLGRKQTSTQAEWLYAIEHIEELISADEVKQIASDTVSAIRMNTQGKKAAYAWSGGKDSIVLADLCETAGVKTGYFAYSSLDYPEFIDWCMEHKPECVIPMDTGYDPDLLKTLTIDLGGADDLMAGYGVISDATKAEMQSAADAYEREEAEFAEGAVEVTPQRPIATTGTPSSAFSPPGNIGVAQTKEPLESSPEPLERRFMICPKCGERIWL